jgi:hypothetical protein
LLDVQIEVDINIHIQKEKWTRKKIHLIIQMYETDKKMEEKESSEDKRNE